MKLSSCRLIAGLISAGITLAAITPASAGAYLKRYDRQNTHGYVSAESWHGHGSVRGRVRPTRLGPQVQLPGGAWIDCTSSCTHALRVNSIDFFENTGRESDGVGYFRFN